MEFCIIDENIANDIVSFIKNRPNIPEEAENIIVSKQKKFYIKKLIGKRVRKDKIEDLKKIIERNFYKSLINPGETVGIIAGQCIGEKTTQSSLNNFHSAGLDTGSTSQIDSLQNIINASKMKKKEVRKYFQVNLYLKNKPNSLKELKEKTIQYLEEIKLKDLINDITVSGNTVTIILNLEKIFLYRITRKQLLENIPGENKQCPPYCSLDENATTINLTCEYDPEICHKIEFIRQIRDIKIVGIEGVNYHIFSQTNDKEWFIQCLCSSINVFLKYTDIYDINRIICNSIHDMYSHFGILVAYEMVIKKCKDIIPDIDESHFKILAMRMTKNGVIEPLTRYTMRNNNSPLSKASFEESFETFIKAAKYNEKEKFKSVSSAIIFGKKPSIGTYQSEILVDYSFYS